MKIYALINGIFYIIYGLYGLGLPHRLAQKVMGWEPNLLGLHQIRALWAALIGIGVVCIMVALKGDLPTLTKAIVFLTLCFMIGRVIGLILDGAGPRQTYLEIGFELVWAAIGLFLLWRLKT